MTRILCPAPPLVDESLRVDQAGKLYLEIFLADQTMKILEP